MSARVYAFPLARRRELVRKCARRMAELKPHKGEEHLARLIEQQCQILARKGVLPDEIATHLRALQCAVRAELWRQVITPGGAA